MSKRDEILRRWLGIEVERATVGALAARPLSERLRELEELFDAALHELSTYEEGGDDLELRDTLDDSLERHRTMSAPFTLALLACSGESTEAWHEALRQSADDGTLVMWGGEGITAAILPGVGPREADVAVDRLRAHAWSAAGCLGRLPAAGRASCPVDGESAEELLEVAHERLVRMCEAALDRSRFERGDDQPAQVTQLYPELS